MICQKCKNPVPQNAQKCNFCGTTLSTSYSLNHALPQTDMFGNDVFEIKKIKHKSNMRTKYLNSLSEMKKVREQNKDKYSSFWLILFIILFFSGVITTALISETNEGLVLPSLIFFASLLFICYKLSVYFTYKRGPEHVEKIFLHYEKEKYYFNQNVIGFAVINHYSDTKEGLNRHFAFCEVDKRNIKGVSYDDKFAEYILHLHRPVYSDYHFPPSCEFRIADIFDDNMLSNALGCDLPAKNMHY